MPQLPCPQCDQKISVAISQAGAKVTCPSCQTEVLIPTLGELRRLASQSDPDDQTSSTGSGQAPVSESATGRRILFGILLLAAGTAAIAGIFCGIRYATIEVPATTEAHIAEVERMYHEIAANQLVREWQLMEKSGLDTPTPYIYKKLEIEKAKWGQNALITLAAFVIITVPALALGVGDSRRKNRGGNSPS